MKAKYFLTVFVVLFLGFFLTSCATMTKEPPANYICESQDLNPVVKRGEYFKKVDNFLVIFDSSATMSEKQTISWYKKQQKFLHAKDLLMCMNNSIPDLELNGGYFQIFFHTFSTIKQGYSIAMTLNQTWLTN